MFKSPTYDDEKASDSGSPIARSIDPEKRLVRKLDWALLPLFTLIYCMNFIDRTAIGNAKIAGIEQDLGLSGYDYNVTLTVFYLFYIAAEIPSNLALKRFGSIWIAAMVTMFGAVSIGTAFIHTYEQLLVTRVFLGIAEGGTLSGLTYIMSRYYRRSELVLRIGIFFGLSPSLAGAFGGLLASGLLSVNDIGTVTSWRKIFLFEGIITTGFGLLCAFILPGDPQTSRLLTEAQRQLALARIDADQVTKTGGLRETTSLRLIIRAFNFNVDRRLLRLLLDDQYILPRSQPVYAHCDTHFTVPPYAVGAVYALLSAYMSFRIKRRAPPILISALLIVVGYAIAIGTQNPHARYAACFLSIAGGSPSGPILLVWGTDNAAPDTVRAVTTAIIPGIGALGSIIAVWTYLPTDAPNYHKGNTLNLATSSTVCVLIVAGAFYIRLENGKRARGERDYRLEGKTEEEKVQLGYLHPEYRYQV